MVRVFLAAVSVAVVLAVVMYAPEPAAAKGRELRVYPAEATWGETVYLDGFNWPGETVRIDARFATTRGGLEAVSLAGLGPRLEPLVQVNGTFFEPLELNKITGQRLEDAPGWVEFIARADAQVGEGDGNPQEMRALVVVTANGQRPADSGFVEGRIGALPTVPLSRQLYAVWAPASNPGRYRFQYVGASDGSLWGNYRTDYLEDGEWLVGVVDVDDRTAALGATFETIRARPPELDHEVTGRFRRVTVEHRRPVAGVDFVMADRATAQSQARAGPPGAAALPSAGAGPGKAGGFTIPLVTALAVGGLAVLGLCSLRRRAAGQPDA